MQTIAAAGVLTLKRMTVMMKMKTRGYEIATANEGRMEESVILVVCWLGLRCRKMVVWKQAQQGGGIFSHMRQQHLLKEARCGRRRLDLEEVAKVPPRVMKRGC